jgi:hypothetical protein
MLSTSPKEHADRVHSATGGYYLATGSKNVMYTLRYAVDYFSESHNRHFLSDRYVKTLSQDYNDAIKKCESFHSTVYIGSGNKFYTNDRRTQQHMTNIFQFGKHRGQTVEEVYENDKKYLTWLVTNYQNKFTDKYVLPLIIKDLHEEAIKIDKIITERQKAKLLSSYQGNIKDRLELDVTLVFKTSFEVPSYSGYGTDIIAIYKMVDGNHNAYIWKTSSCLLKEEEDRTRPIQKGESFRIKGTVKEHSEYKNEKQTILTRCKLLA